MADQTDINELTRKIADLIPVLQKLSTTPTTEKNNVGDRSTNRLINALGKLELAIKGQNLDKKQERRALKEFQDSVDRTTKVQEKYKEQVDKSIEAAKNAAKTQQQLADEAAAAAEAQRKADISASKESFRHRLNTQSATREMIKEFDTGALTTQFLRNEFEKFGDKLGPLGGSFTVLSASAEGVSKAAIQMAKSLYNGEHGATVSANALKALTNPITSLGESVGWLLTALSFIPGPIGIAARGARLLGLGLVGASKALDLYVEYNKLASEQLDTLFKSYNELSASGVGLSGGLDTVFGQLQTMGLTVKEINKFGELIAKNTGKLSLLGPTAAAGLDRFAKVSGTLVKDYGQELEYLGITADEQREAALAYMAIQARTGAMQLKSTKDQAASAAEWIKELDIMAQITGKSRKEMQSAAEANMTESRYRAALFAAERRNDKGEQERLQRAGALAAQLKEAGLVSEATGVLQYAAGGATTPEAVTAMMSFQLDKILNDPNLTSTQIFSKALENGKQQLGMLAETNRFTGEIKGYQASIPALLDASKRNELIQEEARKSGKSVEQYLKDLQEDRITNVPKELQQLVGAERIQRNASLIMDSVVRRFSDAAKLHNQAVNVFADAVSKMPGAKVEGGLMSTEGKPGKQTPALTAPYGRPSPTAPAAAGPSKFEPQAITDKEGLTKYLQSIALTESGGVSQYAKIKDQNGTIRQGKAAGVFQFMPSTWETMVKKMGKNYTLEDRMDPQKSAEVAAYFAQYQHNYLKKELGRAPTNVDMYLAHFLGEAGAAKFLTALASNPNQRVDRGGIVSAGALRDNHSIFFQGGNARTLQEVYDVIGGRYAKGERGAVLGKWGERDVSGVMSTIRAGVDIAAKDNEKKLADKSNKQSVVPDNSSLKDGKNKNQPIPGSLPLNPSAALGGILAGPTSGFQATLHGTEAVIPLPGDRKIPVDMTSMNQLVQQSTKSQIDILVSQNDRLDELISLMRRQASISEKILQQAS